MGAGSVRIHLCGRLVVEWDGERLERDLPGRQGRLLFAYLALNRDRPVRRDELVEALWSEEGPPPTGDSLLAPPLSRLRKAIGASRLEGRGELSLALPDDAWIDWEAARQGLGRARAAIQAGDWRAAWDPAREAVSIAEGGLLPGLEAAWIDERRRELSELRVEALEAIATIGVGIRGASELAAAETAARQAIEAAPFRESARAALMEVLRARGNVAEALMVYDELRTLLMDELGATPSPSIVALYERLLMAGEEPAPPPAAPASTAAPRRAIGLPDALVECAAAPLVGRQAPLQRLRAELASVKDGGASGVVLLAGEGGIGKTRLVAELASEATEFTVLFGRCDEEELFPFGPWIRMLGDYLERLDDDELRPLIADDGPDLARLLPDLRVRFPDLPAPPSSDPETERSRLFAAVIRLAGRLAERSPLLLFLDDLHWADRSSLRLLRPLVRTLRDSPVLLIGTYRDNELSARHALLETLADLERDRPLPRLHLQGLELDEVAALVGDTHGRPVAHATVQTIRDETNGNPFFVKQLVRDLEEGGDSRNRRQSGGFAVPDGLRDVIQSRIARLPEAAERVLQVASLAGREFELAVLERVVDMPEDELLDALDAAVRAGILVEATGVPGRYSFAHSLLRKTLEENLTATRRARVHRRIGEAIEARYRDRLDPFLVDLARHFAAAGPDEVERAVSYSLRAAELAEERLAYDEVVDLSRAALAVRERDEPVDEAERARLLRQLAGALWLAGHWQEARDTYALSADAARKAEATTLFAKAALGHAGSAWERFGTEDVAGIDLLEEALERLPDEDSPLRARVLARLGEALYYSGDSKERLPELAAEAVAMARRVDDLEALADALSAAQYAHWRPGEQERRLEVAYELVDVATRLGDLHFLAEAHAWRATVLMEMGRRSEADVDLDRHARLAYSLQQSELLMHSAALRAMRALLTGRWAEGERAAHEVLGLGERSRAVDARQYFGAAMIALLNEQDRLGDLVDPLEELVRDAGALPGWRTALAWALAQAGRPDAAREQLDFLRADNFAVIPHDANYLAALAIIAHIAGELGDAELAAEVEPLLRPHTNFWVVLGVGAATLGPVAYSVGLLNNLRGRPERAAQYFTVALEKSEVMGARPYVARSQIGLADALRRRSAPGDADRATAIEEEALATARELGMVRLLRETQADAVPQG